MKRKILITGKNSYIGKSFINYCMDKEDNFVIHELDTNADWNNHDFSLYDVVFHVAGIAHNSPDPELEELYYKVNRDLAVNVATKAKDSGVKQFIFMSSMIVFDSESSNSIGINNDTIPNPSNFYGDSKLQAEIELKKLETEDYQIVILRPPMIYGKGSKGNYPLLSKFSRLTPVFPNYQNKRSMLYIDNFCEFVRLMIINEENGTFHPQNREFSRTTEMVKLISNSHNRRILLTRIFNPVIKVLLNINLNIINKVFSDYYYEKSMSDYADGDYQIYSLEESIKLTERS